MPFVRVALLSAALLAFSPPASAQIDARMFRYPDVSADRIAFVHAGDIWVAPKGGGLAQRLSSPPGEELFPRFSPDGSRIAFSANYDGNLDVYVVPTGGGVPTRVTYHPHDDRLVDWDPDGERLLFASMRKSGKQRFNQFYRVGPSGGLPERLPVEFAEFGALSPDGGTLAFTMKARDDRTWKRYRGGTAPDIHTFDLATHASANLTDHPANDGSPMWHRDTLYFLSDRGANQRFNLWARDPSGTVRQVTDFDDFDITYPAIGPTDIVFQAGGRLYLLDLATESTQEVEIDVVTDRASLKPRTENVSAFLVGDGPTAIGSAEPASYGVSATGRRAVFEARGDIFTVPAEHGPVRNLTASSGVADRHPSLSPDGLWVAYWSDAGGEYELTVLAADGSGEPRTLTALGPGYRYTPRWSPDSERVAFVDQVGLIRIVDIGSGAVTEVARSPENLGHLGSAGLALNWSPDGRWLAFSLPRDIVTSAIHLYDREAGETHQVTSGVYDDLGPVFDPDGRYLYLRTRRSLSPSYGDLDGTWIYANTTRIAAVSLRADVPSPLAPRSDEEEVADDEVESADEPDGGLEIDLDDFERRLVVLPVPAGNYTDLQATKGKVIYRRLARTGAGGGDTPLVFWDLAEREEKTVMDDVDDAVLAADGEHLLVRTGTRFGIVSAAPGQSVSTPLRTAELTAPVDPRAEWRQLVEDAWRLERDYFYDAGMHGVDWDAIRDQYLTLVGDAVTRWDVDFVIGEMIAEMNASHTYRGGGDVETASRRPVGVLGVDWALDDGAYRIARIVRGAPWDDEVRSSLDRPGVDVDVGDYVLAVNGVPLDPAVDPAAAFEGLAGAVVALTVSATPDGASSREVLVETLDREAEDRLRHLEWIEKNRRMVEERSGGRVGYVYVPDTGTHGQTELVRQFNAQRHKEALLIDERFNDGGQIPDRFIELLHRPALSWWAGRTGSELPFPAISHQGPKAMLVNGWSGSGGDAFPAFFRGAGLGPIIGTRTWGGLIGFGPAPTLIDGGIVTIPSVRMYENDGDWFAEGHGVDPDIVVPEDVTALAAGRDPQIERAVDWLLAELEERPVITPDRPAPEDRSRPGAGTGTDAAGGRGGSGGVS